MQRTQQATSHRLNIDDVNRDGDCDNLQSKGEDSATHVDRWGEGFAIFRYIHHLAFNVSAVLKHFLAFADNTSLNNNNNNNNHSLNNNTIKYNDKSTQTADCDECEASLKPAVSKDELITAETQTDFTNLHSESICCLSNIPYADMTNSPPPPPPVPYRRINHEKKVSANRHEDDNHKELNQLSVRSLQHSIDTSVGVTTQTALAAVSSVCDNGDVQRKISDNSNGENL